MPAPSLDTCLDFNSQLSIGGTVFDSGPQSVARRIHEFDDPTVRAFQVTITNLTTAQTLSIKNTVFDVVGYHGVFEFTLPSEGSPRRFRFDEFRPTKTAGNTYSLALTMREALGA